MRTANLLNCVLMTAATAAAMAWDLDSGVAQDRRGEDRRADFDRTIARLQELGLRVTADPQKIEQVTSEAAYFMFAQRKDHQPRSEPWKLPEKGHWLDGKPVLDARADKAEVYPLFSRLVEQAGYDTVWIYAADVHYGISNWARFSLYKLGRTWCRWSATRKGSGVVFGQSVFHVVRRCPKTTPDPLPRHAARADPLRLDRPTDR